MVCCGLACSAEVSCIMSLGRRVVAGEAHVQCSDRVVAEELSVKYGVEGAEFG